MSFAKNVTIIQNYSKITNSWFLNNLLPAIRWPDLSYSQAVSENVSIWAVAPRHSVNNILQCCQEIHLVILLEILKEKQVLSTNIAFFPKHQHSFFPRCHILIFRHCFTSSYFPLLLFFFKFYSAYYIHALILIWLSASIPSMRCSTNWFQLIGWVIDFCQQTAQRIQFQFAKSKINWTTFHWWWNQNRQHTEPGEADWLFLVFHRCHLL